MSALDPEARDRARNDAQESPEQSALMTHDQTESTEPTVGEKLKENLDHRSLDAEKEHGGGGNRDVDPVWAWNAPDFLTGDTDATSEGSNRSTAPEQLNLREKTENLRLYFGSLEEYEKEERRANSLPNYSLV
jgi:hypothetical protein